MNSSPFSSIILKNLSLIKPGRFPYFKLKSKAYLLEHNFVDSFAFAVALLHEVVEDVFEVGNEHKLNEVFILLQVKVFE